MLAGRMLSVCIVTQGVLWWQVHITLVMMKGWSWWVIRSSSLPHLMTFLSPCRWTSPCSMLPWQSGQGMWKGTPGGTMCVSNSQLGCDLYTGGLSQGLPQKGFVSWWRRGKGLFCLSEGSWGVGLAGLSGGSQGNRMTIGSKGAGGGSWTYCWSWQDSVHCQAHHQFMIMSQGSGMKNNDDSLSTSLESHGSSVKSEQEDTMHKLCNDCLLHAIIHVHK